MHKHLSVCTLSLMLLVAGCGGSSHSTTPASPSAPAAPSTPTIAFSASSLPSGNVGQGYNQTISVTGGTAPYTWAMASGTNLPAGLSLSTSTGAITGTPTATGASSFSIKVTDSSTPALTSSANYSITVAPALLAVTTTTLNAGVEGIAFSQNLTAAGGNPGYSWNVTGGGLPGGVALSSTGVLSGAATASGTFSFIVTVSDTSSPRLTATKSLTLVIAPPPPAPLAISTTTLAAADVNQPYSQQLTVTGGTAPYSWSFPSQVGLPAGLSLSASGVLSGTPVYPAAGTVQFTVTDATDQTANVTLPIAISANGLLQGQYLVHFTQYSVNKSSNHASAGELLASITLDGQGNITDGIADFADDAGDGGSTWQFTGLRGQYALHMDGTGTLSLTIPNFDVTSDEGVYTFDIAAGSRQAVLNGVDQAVRIVDTTTPGLFDTGVGSGELQLQQIAAATGFLDSPNIILGWQGDTCQICGATVQGQDLAMAGLLNFNSSQQLTVSSMADIASGSSTYTGVTLTGQLAADSTTVTGNTQQNFTTYGRAVLSLTPSGYTDSSFPSTMTVYVVDATHAYALTGSANASLLYGQMQVQAPNPKGMPEWLNDRFLTWGVSQGASSSGSATPFVNSDAIIMQYRLSDYLTGSGDEDQAGDVVQIPSASYTGSGTASRVELDPSAGGAGTILWLSGPNAGFGITMPSSGNGVEPSLLTLENESGAPFSASSVQGNYFLGVSDSKSWNYSYADGALMADGIGSWTGTESLYGFFPENQFSLPLNLTANFTIGSTGRGTVMEQLLNGTTPYQSSQQVFYVASPTRILMLNANSGSPDAAITILQSEDAPQPLN